MANIFVICAGFFLFVPIISYWIWCKVWMMEKYDFRLFTSLSIWKAVNWFNLAFICVCTIGWANIDHFYVQINIKSHQQRSTVVWVFSSSASSTIPNVMQAHFYDFLVVFILSIACGGAVFILFQSFGRKRSIMT